MNRDLRKITEKLRQASERFKKCEILPAGEYSFTVLEATLEHDDKRHYDYLYVRLDCDGKRTSDRFPFVDNMLWKLGDFLAAVGLDSDSWSDEKDLIGRTGKLTSEADTEKRQTYYRYGRAK